jgi:hypothetical protein
MDIPPRKEVGNLFALVLLQAYKDLHSTNTTIVGHEGQSGWRIRVPCREWVLDDSEHEMSFVWYCRLIELDPMVFRERCFDALQWVFVNDYPLARQGNYPLDYDKPFTLPYPRRLGLETQKTKSPRWSVRSQEYR